METVVPAAGSRARPWLERLGQDGLVLASFAVFAGALVLRLVGQLNADGWLALVTGRWIARHGIPHHDTLTVWSHGQAWVDQQWLAQLGFYGLYVLGGIRAVMLAHVAVLTATLAVGNVIALEAGLSYLGIGARAPTASWGSIFFDGVESGVAFFAGNWWVVLFPGIAIVVTVLAFNVLGDALRDVLDPRQLHLAQPLPDYRK